MLYKYVKVLFKLEERIKFYYWERVRARMRLRVRIRMSTSMEVESKFGVDKGYFYKFL